MADSCAAHVICSVLNMKLRIASSKPGTEARSDSRTGCSCGNKAARATR